MGTRDLVYSDTVKYLGILLDSKLTFGPHIRDKTKKAIRLLYRFKTSVGQLWGPSLFLMKWVFTGIIRPKIMYRAIVWANKAINYKRNLNRVQKLGLLAMAHVCFSTPTSGLEAVLGVWYAQCVAVQTAFRNRGRNQSSWDGIGWDHLRGHLFWSGKLLEQMNLGDDLKIGKGTIKELFHNRWRAKWKCLTTCCQTKYWLDVPGSIGDAVACLNCPTLSVVLQTLMGHNYLNYHHHMVGNFSEQIQCSAKVSTWLKDKKISF